MASQPDHMERENIVWMPGRRGIESNESADAPIWHIKRFGKQFHKIMKDKTTLFILEKRPKQPHSKLLVKD